MRLEQRNGKGMLSSCVTVKLISVSSCSHVVTFMRKSSFRELFTPKTQRTVKQDVK